MSPKSAPKPWYTDSCGTAHALELVGERWALLVVRELIFGPRRFGELRAALTGISANVLTQRLEGLEGAGILVRRQLPPPTKAQVYELTPWGYEAEPIFQALGRWGVRSPSHDGSQPLSAASVLLSFRTLLDAKRAANLELRIGLNMNDEHFVAHLHHGALDIERTELADVDATLTAEPTLLAAVAYDERSLADAEAAGELVVEGNRALAKRFLTLFRLPPKAK